MATPTNDTEIVKENAALVAAQTKADETNKTRTGKGTRVKVGQTRGRNPQVISYEAFDEKAPDSLPASLAEFMEYSKVTEEKDVVGLLIAGFNQTQYREASDPIAEFVESAWPDEVQKNFRLAVRNYSQATGSSIEDSVSLIKPGIVKAFEASKK